MDEALALEKRLRDASLTAHQEALQDGLEALQRLDKTHRHMVELALLLSMAVRVTPALLRKVRRKLRPKFPVQVEAQLWASALVQASDRTGFTFYSWAGVTLRHRAASRPQLSGDLKEAWQIVKEHHRAFIPVNQLQAHLQWLELLRQLEPLSAAAHQKAQEEFLASLVTSIIDNESTAARWVFYALPQLEPEVQSLPSAALAELAVRHRLQGLETRRLLIPGENLDPVWEQLGSVLPKDMPREPIFVWRDGDRLMLAREAEHPEATITLELPRTYPLRIRVSWQLGGEQHTWLEVPEKEALRWPIPAGVHEVLLHTAWGEGKLLRISEGDRLVRRSIPRIFLSYCHADKELVDSLRAVLEARAIATWIDCKPLHLDDDLAILEATLKTCDGVVQVVSTQALKSGVLKREKDWALEALDARAGTARPFKLLPLRSGVGPRAIHSYYGRELISRKVAEPIGEVADSIFEALGLVPQQSTGMLGHQPVETNALVIRLSNPTRASTGVGLSPTWQFQCRTSVHHQPAEGVGAVSNTFAFTSPIGELEMKELRWYLERYLEWPYGTFRDRARTLEAQLSVWGKALYNAVFQPALRQVLDWKRSQPGERHIVIELESDDPADLESRLTEAALLSLPWEMLHDERGYLFEGGNGARVVRRIPGGWILNPLVVEPILRILLVLARPEESGGSFMDPRPSVFALTEALEPIGDRVSLTVLPDATFLALQSALDDAHRAGKPFSVVHFDGHGVYDRLKGLGQLCFEDEGDVEQGLLERKVDLVGADRLGSLLQDRRVPLCVLEASQSAQADVSTESSVAVGLLKAGVGSVVAMSHSVLVETTRRFTGAFYSSLAEGLRIGAAMNRATNDLRNKRNRAPAHSDETFELHDWMVPILFQEEGGDLALVPPGAKASPESLRLQKSTRLGRLPEEPPHGFVGRARAIMALHRLLRPNVALVLTAPGGHGKTALAMAAARWLSQTRQVDRVAFVSVEHITQTQAILDTIGGQLIPGYSAVISGGTGTSEEKYHKALLPIKDALLSRPTLLVIDNLETLLPAPGQAVNAETHELLELLERLRTVGQTRILLTSREALPPGLHHRLMDVPRLSLSEGTQLVRTIVQERSRTRLNDEQKARIEALVKQVDGHARALVLLAPLVAQGGAALTTTQLGQEMERLEKLHPGERENSLLASVRLSLERLPAKERKQVRALGVFHAVAHYRTLAHVMQVGDEEALELCQMLVGMGLATANGPYLLLDPALRVTLDRELESEERLVFVDRWFEGMVGLIGYLHEQYSQDAKVAYDGTRIAVMELLAVLEDGERRIEVGSWTIEDAIDATTNLEQLLAQLGLPRFLARVVTLRQRLQVRLGEGWSHAGFNAAGQEIERLLQTGQAGAALARVDALLIMSGTADLTQVVNAYDVAMLHKLKGQILRNLGNASPALDSLDAARTRFQALADRGHQSATRMVSLTLTVQANALTDLGRLEEAAALYEQTIQLDEARDDRRNVAVVRLNLGNVRLRQRRLDDALQAYQKARTDFEALGESASLATTWHQIGMVHREHRKLENAEQAYKQSLKLDTALGNMSGVAGTLNALGVVYKDLGRHPEALTFYRQAEEIFRHLKAHAEEAHTLNNMAMSLEVLGQLDEARAAITRSASVKASLGHSAESWRAWAVLQDIELKAANPVAAQQARQTSMAAYHSARREGWEALDQLAAIIDQLTKLTTAQGPIAARAQVPPAERFSTALHPTRNALLSILTGTLDYAWREDFAIHPVSAVELDRLAEAVEGWGKGGAE